jgi:hypothetical protein
MCLVFVIEMDVDRSFSEQCPMGIYQSDIEIAGGGGRRPKDTGHTNTHTKHHI